MKNIFQVYLNLRNNLKHLNYYKIHSKISEASIKLRTIHDNTCFLWFIFNAQKSKKEKKIENAKERFHEAILPKWS